MVDYFQPEQANIEFWSNNKDKFRLLCKDSAGANIDVTAYTATALELMPSFNQNFNYGVNIVSYATSITFGIGYVEYIFPEQWWLTTMQFMEGVYSHFMKSPQDGLAGYGNFKINVITT